MRENIKTEKDYTDWMVKTGGYAKDMTLRDHYAGLAMPTLSTQIFSTEKKLGSESIAELVSRVAYEFADEMLKERAE
jgi:hypothetical protein